MASKSCPSCKKSNLGPRTLKCVCGHQFNVRKTNKNNQIFGYLTEVTEPAKAQFSLAGKVVLPGETDELIKWS